MIVAFSHPTLKDFVYCANNLAADSRDCYEKMFGQAFRPDDIAAQLWLQGTQVTSRIWSFWETVGNFPAAVGGYASLGGGRWSSWFMDTPDAWKRGQQITDAVRGCITQMFRDPEVRRLETVTLLTRGKARSWYEKIGLTYDPTCDSCANGHDLVTYVAVRP